MADIELFGKIYNIKDFTCGKNKTEILYRNPGVILYIRAHNECNGKCKFCLNCEHKTVSKIDFKKLRYVVRYLTHKGILSTVTITGGEPMIAPDYINEIINTVVEANPKIKISISTNGTNLEKILEFDNFKNIEYIHVSRHHYDDNKNDEIMGIKSIPTKSLKIIQEKSKNIIINTVVSKETIYKDSEVIKMIDYAHDLQSKRIHLVSLINYNDYCEKNYVDLNKVFYEIESKNLVNNVDSRYRKEYCECHIYQYKEYNLDDFLIMTRLTHQNSCGYVEQLVYTNDNFLITGFDSKQIIF